MGIPDTEYSSVVTLSSADFSRICKELSNLAESMTIETSKDAVKFSISGDNGRGSISLNARDSDKVEE